MQMQLQQRGGGAASVGSSSFGSSGGLEISKPHQCQQCLKSFSSNHQLVQHIRVHTGEKPYKCSYCERRFKQLSHVQQHTRLHTGRQHFCIIYYSLRHYNFEYLDLIHVRQKGNALLKKGKTEIKTFLSFLMKLCNQILRGENTASLHFF